MQFDIQDTDKQRWFYEKHEIEKCVSGLKEELASETIDEESKKQLLAVMGQFEKEDDYWDYQKQVYAKLLPIQKYVSSIEKRYFDEHSGAGESEWLKYFENYKKELMKMENFTLKTKRHILHCWN